VRSVVVNNTQRKQMALFGCILWWWWSEWTLLSKQLDLNRRLFEGSTIESSARPNRFRLYIDKNKFYFFNFYACTPPPPHTSVRHIHIYIYLFVLRPLYNLKIFSCSSPYNKHKWPRYFFDIYRFTAISSNYNMLLI